MTDSFKARTALKVGDVQYEILSLNALKSFNVEPPASIARRSTWRTAASRRAARGRLILFDGVRGSIRARCSASQA